MSVFGSLFTAVSGLTAQSQALGMISNNIANVSTVGFKRTDAAFSSLVTSESRSLLYSPGSVQASQNARISQQGILQQSNSATDIALTGNGFFVVKNSTSGLSEPLYTRAGSFSEDETGNLRNTAGFYLYGWPLDSNGAIPAGASDINSLVPVNVSFLTGLTQPTTDAALAINLDSTEDNSAYPLASGWVPDFTRGLRVYDSLGAGHDLTVNFKKSESPTAIATGTTDLRTVGSAFPDPTASFDIAVGGGTPTTITLDGDVAKLLNDINSITDGSGNPVAYANLDADGNLVIKARTPGEDVDLTAGTPDGLGDVGLAAGTSTAPAVPGMLGGMALNGPANTEGWWVVQFQSPTGSIEEGYVNFNGAGQINFAPNAPNGAIDLNLAGINWGNGSDLQDFTFDISGFTQLSGEYNVISSRQNGAELGLRTGVSIDKDGYVTAQFSNGQSTKIYKLAIATFANSNGLNELTGNVWRESDTSGNFNLREAGSGSAGVINSGALESSNVDLADEFSRMIITQRAYSANTKVISTADDMTEELLRLR
jgi:flagellar hook protein FlgE